MDARTVAALEAINRRFYRLHAAEFDRARRSPWPGWERVVEILRRERPSGGSDRVPAILDLGCGNGRFGSILERRLEGRLRYLGLDASVSLLASARRRIGAWPRSRPALAACDLADLPLPVDRATGPADCVALFGVLHHIAGLARRRRLIESAAALIAPGGLLALSFWQFGGRLRFQRRVIPWREHNRTAREVIAIEKLERGDLLLAWGDAHPETGERPPSARRYCHWADRREAERLVAGLGLEQVELFASDGDSGNLNLYALLRRPGSL